MARTDKSVDIAIRARDEYSKALKKAQGDLQGFAAAQARTQGRRDLLTDSKGKIAETRKELRKARAEATELGKILYGGGQAPKGFDTLSGLENLEAARARVAKLENSLVQYGKQLDVVRNKEASSFAAFSKGATAIEQKAAATRRSTAAQTQQSTVARALAGNLDNLAAASRRAKGGQDSLAASVEAARARTQAALNGGPQRMTVFDKITQAWSSQNGRGPLGLRPYELTNLSYQLNDVATGLAMGQPPMQVFAQQAGQIAQIFPKFISGFLKLTPVIAILTPFAVALARVNREASLMKELDIQFALDVDADDLNTAAIKNLIIEADRAGLTLTEAKKAVTDFIKADFDQSDIPNLIDMSQRLARATGSDIPTAVDTLVKAFSNGIDGVVELDQELNFLTASQYENIRALEEQGKTAEAVALGLDALEGRLEKVSTKSGGPWADAMRSLGGAWNDFIDMLANSTAVQGMAEMLTDLGQAVSFVANALNKATSLTGPKGLAESLVGASDADLARRRAGAEDYLRASQARRDMSPGNAVLGVFGKEWAGLAEAVEDAQQLVIMMDAVAAIPAEMRTMDNVLEIARAVENGESLATVINDIVAGTDAQAGSAEAVTEATEASKKEALDIQRTVDETVEAMDEEARLANLTARERFIETKTLELRNKLLKEGKDLTIEQLNAIRESAAALFDAQNPLDAAAYEAQFTATRFSPKGEQMGEIVRAATLMAEQLGLKVEDVLTAISYETAGTFDPWKAGPTTQWGQHRGLIQWGEPQREKYGVTENSTIGQQMAAVGKYLTDAGVKAGDGLLQIYAAINAGGAGNIHASDANNGGAPGTVLDKVQGQMSGHRAKAQGLVAAYGSTVEGAEDEYKAQEKADTFHEDMALKLEAQRQENELVNENIIARETAKALAQAELAAKKAGTELTAEERDLIKQNVAAKYAKAAADEQEKQRLEEGKRLQQEVTLLMERRKFLQDQMNQAVQMGDRSKAGELAEELRTVNTELDTAISKATAFWSSMSGTDAELAVQKLQQTKVEIKETGRQSLITADSINNLIVGTLSNAASVYAQSVAEGKTGAEALAAAFRQAASDILIQLGQMIMKQILFNTLAGGRGGSGGGGIGGMIAGFFNSAVLHTGGIAGSATRSRNIAVDTIANAPRFHNGTPGNLKANELVAVLEDDEEVLTSQDPRHRKNLMKKGFSGMADMESTSSEEGQSSGGGTQGRSQTIVNALDAPSMLEAALSAPGGEDIFLNFVRSRREEIKAEIE